jgi:hypothetical protein
MSYFSATMKMNAEGDILISDDTAQGLGTAQRFLHFLFGSLFLVARALPYTSTSYSPGYNEPLEMASGPAPSFAISQSLPPRPTQGEHRAPLADVHTELVESFGTVLIGCVPHAGYFVAGAIAGIVSRTSTAPLDRLKVYLIAQTSAAKKEAVAAAKSGNIFRAAANAWRPLATATKELWHAGGMRSLYAGQHLTSITQRALTAFRKRTQRTQSHARVCHEVWCIRGRSTDQNLWQCLIRVGCEASFCQTRRPQRPDTYTLVVPICFWRSCRLVKCLSWVNCC